MNINDINSEVKQMVAALTGKSNATITTEETPEKTNIDVVAIGNNATVRSDDKKKNINVFTADCVTSYGNNHFHVVNPRRGEQK